jgi:hypothetical protein
MVAEKPVLIVAVLARPRRAGKHASIAGGLGHCYALDAEVLVVAKKRSGLHEKSLSIICIHRRSPQ